MGNGDGTKGAGANKIAGAVTSAANLAKTAFGKTGIDTSGATPAPSVPSKGASALSGAMQGAQAGMAFGLPGTLIGTATGTLTHLSSLSMRSRTKRSKPENIILRSHYQRIVTPVRLSCFAFLVFVVKWESCTQ